MLRSRPAPSLLSIALLISSVLQSSSSSSSLIRNSTRRLGAPDPRFNDPDEDYDNIYDETVITKSPRKTTDSQHPPCNYDLCKDQQETCQNLSFALSCSCPGISGPFQPPDPPVLQSLSLDSKGKVVVRWCAPSSTVTHYLVQVDGQVVHSANVNRRMIELGNLAPGTEVCVKAVNKVGVSTKGTDSCTNFDPNTSETRLIIKLVLIGAAVMLVIVILVVALMLWRCRRHRKTSTRTANP
ncbi:leucine-rich repeat neuronal protein 4 isoform X2 [Tachysurus fulvidraco]|nr:leucine-rich repeat neuronal protein 4 isoform X2 [Tachysurus fulvidraco]